MGIWGFCGLVMLIFDVGTGIQVYLLRENSLSYTIVIYMLSYMCIIVLLKSLNNKNSK